MVDSEAVCRSRGSRGQAAPLIDGLLAATAMHHNLTFVTRNVSQVEAAGVLVFDPWD